MAPALDHTNSLRGRDQKTPSDDRAAAAIAHHFNNVFGVIAGYARLLAESLPDEDSRHDARAIVDATKRGQELVRQLLVTHPMPSGGRVANRDGTEDDSYRVSAHHRSQ
jgi:nitrogen-specific signal transduction histidine kinase